MRSSVECEDEDEDEGEATVPFVFGREAVVV
jgi:hypothetical protein